MSGNCTPYLDELFENFEDFADGKDEFKFNDFIRYVLKDATGLQIVYVKLLHAAIDRPGGPLDGAHQAIGLRLKKVAQEYGYTDISRGKDETLWGAITPDSSIYSKPD